MVYRAGGRVSLHSGRSDRAFGQSGGTTTSTFTGWSKMGAVIDYLLLFLWMFAYMTALWIVDQLA